MISDEQKPTTGRCFGAQPLWINSCPGKRCLSRHAAGSYKYIIQICHPPFQDNLRLCPKSAMWLAPTATTTTTLYLPTRPDVGSDRSPPYALYVIRYTQSYHLGNRAVFGVIFHFPPVSDHPSPRLKTGRPPMGRNGPSGNLICRFTTDRLLDKGYLHLGVYNTGS